MDRKSYRRSNAYQHLLVEMACSNDMMSAFSNKDSMCHRLDPFKYDEELNDLQDQLKTEFWRIVNEHLTDRQKEVIRLYTDGFTQMEIAKKLNVNQSSITKSLNGNVDYKNYKNNKPTNYGGSLRRVRKLVQDDLKIRKILDRISEIREEKL